MDIKIFKYVAGRYSTKTIALLLLEGAENHQEIIDKYAPKSILSQGCTWTREEYIPSDLEIIKRNEMVLANGAKTFCKKGNEFKNKDYDNYTRIANDPKNIIMFS